MADDESELVATSKDYPILRFVRRHGLLLGLGAATAAFLITTGSANSSARARMMRGAILGLGMAGVMAYTSELTEVVAQTLLPE